MEDGRIPAAKGRLHTQPESAEGDASLFDTGLALGRLIAAKETLEERYVAAEVRARLLHETLAEALEYVERFEDVRDGDYGEPEPNEAMQLAAYLRTVLAKTGPATTAAAESAVGIAGGDEP